MTAARCYLEDLNHWKYLSEDVLQTNKTQNKIFYHFQKQFGKNKENKEQIKEKTKYYGQSRWPSLVVIPDVAQNKMILKETQKVGLPVLGLVNSHCSFEIDYPIFAQDQSISNIYFFCHFLATLIAKEMVYLQHKRYTLQKIYKKRKKLKQIKKLPEKRKYLRKNQQKNQKTNLKFFTKKKFVSKFVVPKLKAPFKSPLKIYQVQFFSQELSYAQKMKIPPKKRWEFSSRKKNHWIVLDILRMSFEYGPWNWKGGNWAKLIPPKQLFLLGSFLRKQYRANYVNSKNNQGPGYLLAEQNAKKYLALKNQFFLN